MTDDLCEEVGDRVNVGASGLRRRRRRFKLVASD